MKRIIAVLCLSFAASSLARAEALSRDQADAICRAKALRAAHFLAESTKKFVVTFITGDAAEISTPVIYELSYPGMNEPVYTVVAYAYPDDKSCLIGSVTNNIAGND